uniref:N-acetyltransferase domain-containing protein n=1 Tax=viral metagenome TaxID=1070528 RepID=A0A6C0KJH9_9ZZZZ
MDKNSIKNSTYIVRLKEQDYKEKHNTFISSIKNIITNNKSYTQDVIEKGFLQECFEDSDFVYLCFVDFKIRGFAIVNHYKNGYKLDVIGIAPYPNVDTRNLSPPKKLHGKDIIKRIVSDAKRFDKKFIILNSVDDKITYYYNHGFRFIQHYLQEEKIWMKENVDQLFADYRNNEDKVTMKQLLKNRYFKRYLNNIYKFKYLEKKNDDDTFEDILDDGIKMIKVI